MNDRLIDLRGYGTVEKWVLTNPNISIGAKGLYALICAYAGSKDNAYPSGNLICMQLNISKSTLQKYLKELKNNNCIGIEQIREGGKFSHNVYTLLACSTDTQNLVNDKTVNGKTVNDNSNTKNNSSKNNSFKNNSSKNTGLSKNENPNFLNMKANNNKENKNKNNNIDYKQIVDKYNSINGISKIIKLTDKRKKLLNARIKEYNIETVINILDKVNKSEFLKGNNNRNWKANFDWIFNTNNFIKILENKYNKEEIKEKTIIKPKTININNSIDY